MGITRLQKLALLHVLRTNITNKLKADQCRISNLEMESLARALAANSTLEELDISYNYDIGDIGIGHIGTALLTNTTLKILNISNCNLPPCLYTGSNHMIHICTALQTNTSLTTLNFAHCGISTLVAESLARALAVNSTLEELDISNNYNIGDIGIGHIGTALLTNTTLKILNISSCSSSLLQHCYTLSNNMIFGAQISTALPKNTILIFSSCGIPDLVEESLARALAVNSTLEKLYIINDNIRDSGIAHIAKSLQKNNTLKVLHVGTMQYKTFVQATGFTDTGVLSLARGVATNTSIEYLSIQWSSTHPDSTLKMMAESIKNSSLKTLALTMWILPPGASTSVLVQEQTLSEKASKWFQCLEVGVRELILSFQYSHLELFRIGVPEHSRYGCSWEYQTAVDLVNSARHNKGLPEINFSFEILIMTS